MANNELSPKLIRKKAYSKDAIDKEVLALG